MESEYIACSTAMRMLLYIRNIHEEICTHCVNLKIPYKAESAISTVFQDNQAALILATTDPPRMTPRSKSIAVKYHWFRQYLHKDKIVMKDIDTKYQLANIFTKPLSRVQFHAERKMLMNLPDSTDDV
jgi:hypothetical protein